MCDRLAPHQLDFDWRFTERTALELASFVGSRRALLLGCPTVAEALSRHNTSSVLIDRQPATTCTFPGTVLQSDIRELMEPPPGPPFEIIIIDSPWYPEDLLVWLDYALSASAPGTSILFSLWPDKTRPSAASELAEIFAKLAVSGRADRSTDALRYLTPGFEHSSMPGIGQEWRFGDLGTLTVSNPSRLKRERTVLQPTWARFAFGDYQVALKVDRSRSRSQNPAVAKIFQSWYIPTVSRRQPALHDVELWTSDNEVGRVKGGGYFYNALHAVAQGTESHLTGKDKEALTILLDNGFVPAATDRRRLEWMQFD